LTQDMISKAIKEASEKEAEQWHQFEIHNEPFDLNCNILNFSAWK
jgi:hypothetical protein